MLPPLQFVPFLRPMVWGGRRLGTSLGKQLPTDEPYGESWEISDHPLHRSVVASGPFQGRTLHQLIETRHDEMLGYNPFWGVRHERPPWLAERLATFPLLVKYLDACDWLSVQVHPDEDAVQKLWPGERSKTEAWFVLAAAPGSRIYAGLLPNVSEPQLRKALEAGKIAECLSSFEPRPGDCVFLPAGTVHAVGGGVLLAEVQQTSDATFRLYDWNRRDAQGKPRKLHIEEGLASIHWDQGQVLPMRVLEFSPPAPTRLPVETRHSLVRCPYFDLDFVRGSGECIHVENQPRGMRVLMVLSGSGVMTSRERTDAIMSGQTWLLPAALPAADFKGDFSALYCTTGSVHPPQTPTASPPNP